MSIQSQLGAALSDSREQWRNNARLRYGVYAIFAIMWFYGILVLRDAVSVKREAWLAAESRIGRSKVLASSGDWASRADEAKAALNDFESLLWKEGSLGLAQAAVQESINRSLAAGGLISRQVKVVVSDTPLSPDMPEVVAIRARVLVDFRPAAVNAWLAAMARDVSEKKPAMVVESLSVRGAPSPTADFELVAYALKPESTAPANSNGGAANGPSSGASK